MTNPKQLLLNRLGDEDKQKWRDIFASDTFQDILTQTFAGYVAKNGLSADQTAAVTGYLSQLLTFLEPPEKHGGITKRRLDYSAGLPITDKPKY